METKKKSRLQRLIFSRFIVTSFFLILQIALLTAIYGWLRNYNQITLTIMMGMSIALGIFLINSRENPAYKAEWLLIIGVFPIFGTFLYLFIRLNIGTTMPRKLLREVIKETAAYEISETEVRKKIGASDLRIGRLATYLEDVAKFPVYSDTQVTYYSMCDNLAEPLVEAIESAKEFIFLEFFIIKEGSFWTKILDALEKKAKEGVEVRLLYDGMGCLGTIPEDYYTILRKKNINARSYAEIQPFLSTEYNNRDHRKVLVVDNRIAFTGGFNLADEYTNEIELFGVWKDTAVRLTGDAVNSFTMMFLQMWNSVFVQYRAPENYQRYLWMPNGGKKPEPLFEDKTLGKISVKDGEPSEKEDGNGGSLANAEETEVVTARGTADTKNIVKQLAAVDKIIEKVIPESKVSGKKEDVQAAGKKAEVKVTEVKAEVKEKKTSRKKTTPKAKKTVEGFVIPYADGPHEKEPIAENVYMDVVSRARRYVYIMTPYLTLTDEMKRSIMYAAKSGVDVRIILPHIPDKKGIFAMTRSYYPELIESGVHFYEYTPGFMHAKMIVADDEIATVGTINFDFRSLFLHYECGVLFYQHDIISEIKKDFDETIHESQYIRMEDYKKISTVQRLRGWVMRIIAPLL